MSDVNTRTRTASRLGYVVPDGMEIAPSPIRKSVGRYEVKKTLGKGAMGVVYKAVDPLLDRIVAIKTIAAPKDGSKRVKKAYLERFEREAKAAAKMQHPSIVTIFDVGNEMGAPYMVLEYLPGESLADRLDKVRMPLAKSVQIGLDLASALGFAHKERVVHRDVKPANILHAGDSRWKLADFGIVRLPDSDLTQVGIFMGTPGYAPKEAIGQGLYTAQADVFAWGAVLYELLCGRIPYEGPDTKTTNGLVLKNKVVNPRNHDPSIPVELSEVVMRALNPDTGLRYADGLEAEKALRDAWEKCIQENKIPGKAFSSVELPHGRAPKAMHGAGPMPTPPAPPMEEDLEPTKVAPVKTPGDQIFVKKEELSKGQSLPARPQARKKMSLLRVLGFATLMLVALGLGVLLAYFIFQ